MNRTFVRRHGDRLRGPVACAAVAIIAAGGLSAPLAAPSLVSAAAATHYVTPGESIQDAVDAAESGDTILVAAGTYAESVTIDKALTLRSEDGADVTIIDGGDASQDSFAIRVTAHNVTVEGFTVKTGDTYEVNHRGIWLDGVHECIIRSNHATNNWRGISQEWNAQDSSYNNVIALNVLSNNFSGITCASSSGGLIERNSVLSGMRGIEMSYSSDTVSRNTISTTDFGVVVGGGCCYVEYNTITSDNIGICPTDNAASYFYGNTITGCATGFFAYGIGHIVYWNNFVDNTVQAQISDYTYGWTLWYHEVTDRGNYWSDYLTRYPDAQEVGETGVYDTPYLIREDPTEGNKDLFPLVSQYVPPVQTWTLSVDGEGQGTVEIDSVEATLPYSDEYEDSTQVTLTATAAEGSRFTGWTGDISSTESEITITMEQDTSVTAVFEPESIDIVLQAGWNMISVPVTIGNNTVAEVFAEIDYGDIYTWIPAPAGGSYLKLEGEDDIDPHRAYWVSITTAPAEPVTLTGEPVAVDEWSASLSIGWNMVGTAWSETSIPLSDLGDGGSGALQNDAIYWWDAEHGTYELLLPDEDLVPGVGYWMACTAGCTVTMAPPGV